MDPSNSSNSPESDYFNNLSQHPAPPIPRRASQDDVPKPKRIACVLCRKRKLKCDGGKPSCATCTRLQHDCNYDEVRRKSGPKRGYVKTLEARLARLEAEVSEGKGDEGAQEARREDGAIGMAPVIESRMETSGDLPSTLNGTAPMPANGLGEGPLDANLNEPFPWEMIGLGLDEPLPPQEAMDELTQAYFDKIHPSAPMIHRPRFMAAMNLAPHMRPPICLRYAMWANAAAVSDRYENLAEHFYHRCRKYLQQDEMKGHGEGMITLAHAQTWVLMAFYEFKMMFFPRAWMSAGRACRMVQMMGLHRLDGSGLDVKQCLPPPRDWTEREERRRTFWMSFCTDRYSSIGTGWPMTIEEKDVMTILPVNEDEYQLSKPRKTMTLAEALDPSGAPNLSSFGGVILMATLFGRNLTHLHRPGPDDKDDDLNGDFWKRHRAMENVLLNTALALPDQLRLPYGLSDPNIIFLNMNIHTSAICLHQAAIFKADRNRLPARVSAESKVRCITAAAEIASIMRTISHLDLSAMNPFISFCLYVAARVFVQYLKSRPKDGNVLTSLRFLLAAMHAIKRKNPLTESFLVQLDVDLESAGLEDSASLRASMPKQSRAPDKTPGCVQTHLAMEELACGGRPTYGDTGLAVYNQPDAERVPKIAIVPRHVDPFTYSPQELNPHFADFQPVSTQGQYDLPNREQRTPGSMHTINDSAANTNTYRSPPNFNGDMDTSPDGSGGENQSPGSLQHTSSHTSHTGYSPSMQDPKPTQQQYQQQTNGSSQVPQQQTYSSFPQTTQRPYDPLDFSQMPIDYSSFPSNSASTTFSLPPSNTAYTMPATWNSSSSTGFTPGPSTGFTPNAGGMGDLPVLSEAEWSAMLEQPFEWETTGFVAGEGNVLDHMATAGRR
ncbi:hypothetical protein B0A48_02865 [Cryoendolithus antarcticus]|uniref:Zn(2)-C6 fungal-type domain-containing protein n=1 Tax=Cryoendolithus antarcticus TaxID=1507870 RepID=A0A1V8TLP1_9PEZI|nr:hypothetical protein B0A48_02865 [Cryoendolithus antarcticus]